MSFRVAIDSGPLTSGHSVRGIGVMVKEQIEAFNKLKNNNVRLEAFDFNSESGKTKLLNKKFEIVHYPYFFPYSVTLPKEKMNSKLVVTIQDLIHLIYPKQYPAGIRGKLNFMEQKSRLKSFDAVLTISETSKKDIIRFLDVPPERVTVLYLAPKKIFKKIDKAYDLTAVKNKYKLPDKFVLYVGDVNYNKNILTLIKACETAKVALVIAGKQAKEIEQIGLLNLMDIEGPKDWYRFLFDIPHPEHAHYQEMLQKFNNKSKIYRLGYIPDNDLALIFNLASVYVQASYYEGFGLPVLEAMASGTPVVVSKTNCLVEIAGDAALIADPHDHGDFADKILKIIRNKNIRENLINKGKLRAKLFTWEKTAKGMLNFYRKIREN